MANFRQSDERKDARNLKYEEFVPSWGWTEDSQSHHLRVDLPGFMKGELKSEFDTSGNIVIMRERKNISFKKTFYVPENSDIKNLAGKFEGGILNLNVPKKVIEEKKELVPENDDGGASDKGIEEEKKPNNSDERSREKGGQLQARMLGNVIKEIKNKRGIIITGVLAFSLGVLVSHIGKVMEEFKNNKGIVITAALAFSLGVLVTHIL